jgi:hypothetical protein
LTAYSRRRRCPQKFASIYLFSSYFSLSLVSPILDLIRHGKNHIHVRQDDSSNSQQPAAPTTDARSQPERRQQVELQPQSQPKQQQASKAQPATTKQSQHITWGEVEKIVREEREAMEKMPAYKGSERYRLVEKKGECAIFTRII